MVPSCFSPLSLTAAAPSGRRPKAAAARRPSWPGRLGPPPPELRQGIDSSHSPLPFPSLPERRRAPRPPARRRRRAAPSSSVSREGGGRRKAILPLSPSLFTFSFMSPPPLSMFFFQKNPLCPPYLRDDPSTLQKHLHLSPCPSSMPWIFPEMSIRSFALPKVFTNKPLNSALAPNHSFNLSFQAPNILRFS